MTKILILKEPFKSLFIRVWFVMKPKDKNNNWLRPDELKNWK